MHEGHRERLKERFIESELTSFAEHEVLELLLCYALPRKDLNPLAHRLIEAFGSLSGTLSAHPLELLAIDGVGKNAAVLLSLVRSVNRRIHVETAKSAQIRSPQDAVNYLCALLSGRKVEQFTVLMLNAQHRLIYTLQSGEGTTNQSTIYPRTVVEGALRHAAASVILAHNHPGGSIEPSAEDIESTERMRTALEAIGIPMLDHFVVAEEAAYAIIRKKAYRYENEHTMVAGESPEAST